MYANKYSDLYLKLNKKKTKSKIKTTNQSAKITV